jgi:hypothetical protein
MMRPTLEVADIIRAQGERFIERSRSWLTWAQRKVLYAIARCRIVPSPITRVLWEVLPNGECAVFIMQRIFS